MTKQWQGANVGEPDWARWRDAKIRLEDCLGHADENDPENKIEIFSQDLYVLLSDQADYMKESRARKTRDETEKGRHYNICRSVRDLIGTLEAIPDVDPELVNMASLLLRMAIKANGGQVSDDKLRRF